MPIYLHPELASWAKEQVQKGVASSVESLVIEAVIARKRDGEWLDRLVKSTLQSVELKGWVNGEGIMRNMDLWLSELDAKIEDFEAFRIERGQR